MFEQLPQLLVSGFSLGAAYALVALAFFAIYSGTRLFNFALGEFVVFGMFFMFTLQGLLGLPPVLAFVLTVVLVSICSALFERSFLAPARGHGLLVLINITVGGSIMLRTLALNTWGRGIHFVSPLVPGAPIEVVGARIVPQSLVILGVVMLVLAGAYYIFTHTMWGRSIVATAINQEGARVIGINSSRVSMYVWLISGTFSGVAGALLAPIVFAEFTRGFSYMMKAYAGAMLGGVGSPVGVVIGGLLLGLIEIFGGFAISSQFREILVAAIIIVVLLVRPQGIFARKGATAVGVRD